MEESGLLLLPDDALLAVLAYVTPRQLLDLRVLCRRLRDICVHPDLWRSVHLKGRLVLTALRLVPCLGGVTVWGDWLPRVASEISTCTCVVACLDLYVLNIEDLVPATAIAERVAALGGMKALSLDLHYYELPLQPFPALLNMLFNTQQLRELELAFQARTSSMAPWRDLEGTASLKRLAFKRGACDRYLLESLLRTHAATLESVELFHRNLPSSLKDLPKLQSLAFNLKDYDEKECDLSVLAGIADLETLHIRDLYVTHCPPEVLDLLRRSSRLRSVKLPRIIRDDSRQQVLEAVAALLLFPSLQALNLGKVSFAEFQGVVSSILAPNLRTLRIQDHGCPHGSLHDVNVQNLLARNPQLHFWPGRISFSFCYCQWCESGCHRELEMLKCRKGPALASHVKRIGCPANCFQLKC